MGDFRVKKIALYFITFLLFLLTACGSGDISEEVDANNQDAPVEIEEEETEEAKEDEETKETESNETTATSTNPDELQIHFIDVGQADATLLQYTDEERTYNILFDAGDWRGNEVVSYLTSNDVSALDLVVISHPDADHIGQLDKVIQSINVGEVWMSGNESSSQTFQQAVEAVLSSDADYDEPRAGDQYDIGPMAMQVLHPDDISDKVNEESIAILFTFGNIKILLTGDANKQAESKMRNNFEVNADILHLGHHGSNTSSDPAFIDAVAPRIAVYSAGENNSYSHPSPEVVSTILDRDITLYGTDEHGTIVITTDGEKIKSIETGTNTSPIKQEENMANTQQNEDQNEADEVQTETEPNLSPGCININHSSITALQGIIHIGDVRAEELIHLRPFQSVADMERINGIGPARIADIISEGKACVE
jgi:beta-lactamase superfamily II metal-dependent hydrolase